MTSPAIQPASSSDDGSQSSASDIEQLERRMEAYDSDGVGGEEEEDEDDESKPVTNFDDLPTDDSESDSDSEQGSDADGDSSSDSDGSEENGVDDQADVPLSERVASRALIGRRYYTRSLDNEDDGKRQRAQRKSRAIELASQRLRDARKGKSALKKSTDSDESSVDGTSKRKKSKHAPTEMSSKRRDFYSRKGDLNNSGIGVSIGANKYKPRDPRMVSLSGHLDADLFEKRYGFLDEVQDKEIEGLKQRLNAWKTSGKKGQKLRRKLGMTQGGESMEDDQEELKRLLQERAERTRSQMAKAAKRSVKKKIREEVASGKRGAYYPKKNEMRRMEMEAKFEEIRKRGGDEAVDKAIAKRRKKNVAKSHKLMPTHLPS